MSRKGKKGSKKDKLEWMMWQIEEKQLQDPPIANLIRAIQYYNEKYGAVPNRCEVSNKWSKEMVAPEGMTLTRTRSVQPDHIMLALDPELHAPLPVRTAAK
jgi:hypothetical protein